MMTAQDIANQFDIPQEHRDTLEKAIELIWQEGYRAATRWIPVEEDTPVGEVWGYNPEWIDQIHNPQGIRRCTQLEDENPTPARTIWVYSYWNPKLGEYMEDVDSNEAPTHWQPIFQIPTSCTPTATPLGE